MVSMTVVPDRGSAILAVVTTTQPAFGYRLWRRLPVVGRALLDWRGCR